jgi:hypothetical protein
MDKARHPHVIRTWRVERTKLPYRPPPPAKTPAHPFFSPPRRSPRPPAAPPEKEG